MLHSRDPLTTLKRPLERGNQVVKLGRDLRGRSAFREGNGLADGDADVSPGSSAALGDAEIVEAVNAHRKNRNAEILGEKADTGSKLMHSPIGREFAFREDDEIVATVDRFAGEMESFAKAAEFGKREDVEEKRDKKIVEAVEQAAEKSARCRGTAHGAEAFAMHGNREAIAESRRERSGNVAGIHFRDVVADDEQRAADSAEIFASAHARVGEDVRGRPGKDGVDEIAHQSGGPALRPAGVNVGGSRWR